MSNDRVEAPRPHALVDRLLIGTLIFLVALLIGIGIANAATNEIIPSVGLTRAIHGDETATPYAGLALRTGWAPFLKSEVGVAYRQDKFDGGNVKMTSWPVTASLWLSPVPVLYVGGGAGWYNTTTQFAPGTPQLSFTKQKLGTHVGGGLETPLGPGLGLDLNVRYVFLEKDQSGTTSFDRSNWVSTAGIAIHF